MESSFVHREIALPRVKPVRARLLQSSHVSTSPSYIAPKHADVCLSSKIVISGCASASILVVMAMETAAVLDGSGACRSLLLPLLQHMGLAHDAHLMLPWSALMAHVRRSVVVQMLQKGT